MTGNNDFRWTKPSLEDQAVLVFCPDPFVKIQLVHGLKLAKTKKTSCKRATIDPFYNESFSFKVPQEELESASLVFTGMFTYLFQMWFVGLPYSWRILAD